MKHRSFSALFMPLMAVALLWLGAAAHAATTDIANAPMASASSSVVKPNIMFTLDDSGSMQWTYLGDSVYLNGYVNQIGYRSALCNRIYYDPNINYSLPVNADGTPLPTPPFTAAFYDGYTGSNTVNLSSGFMAWRSANSTPATPGGYNSDCWNVSSGSPPSRIECTAGGGSTIPNTQEPAYYFLYKGSKAGNLGDNSSKDQCKDYQYDTSASTGTKNWYKVIVGATSGPGGTDERQNFANWFSYYRTRIMAMKSAAGRAFKSIDSKYRVGFNTINYTETDNANSKFLNISDFDATQKSRWYAKFYAINPSGGTPLQQSLAKVGQIYAGKIGTDPVQYSCQQNFAILSTDGFWNGAVLGTKIDGVTAVGDQDGSATTPATPRPMLDGLNQSDTLADVAMYYYKTDLRTPALNNCTGALGGGIDVCENNVPGAGADINTQQHMTTFTLGLGANGTLAYAEDYLSGGSADYNAIVQGTKNWPIPVANTPTTIDDLWHAAVNGRGTYFSAKNPDALVSGISKALAGVSARTGAAAAAATSNLEPVAGDNFVYVALYRTVKWDGDLQAKTIDPNTGVISTTPVWSAQPLLDARVSGLSDTRTIYTFDSATNGLKLFTWANLNATEQGYFNNMCSPTAKLSQCTTLTLVQQTAASGLNLVNFIRGQDGFEDQASNTNRIYRDREHVLGDMISSQPVYVKTPAFAYVDDNYSTFRDTTQKNRQAMVYVAVNDGMLHAFNGDTGAEQWAYIPPMVMPNLYKLADQNYSTNHQYSVDGSPTVGDICPNAPASACSGAQWKTILVGGLNAGGRGYYALDITDPANPKALWNFTVAQDPNLGYTFGNPVITKRHDGTWVVAFTSGYNNVSGGDGKGYLYVLNANTGAILEKIGTNIGDTNAPSGLAKINAWVNDVSSNTAERFYGGDLLGNVWRFDIDDVVPPAGKEAFLVAQVGLGNGANQQSITTKPELTEIAVGAAKYAVVNVATGRYLGLSDLTDTNQQSVYAFKDNLTATGLGNLRLPGAQMVKQTLTTFTGSSGQQLRTSSTNPVDWASQNGWYVDLNPNNESPGERVNVDMQQQLGLLTVASNVPNTNACTVGGFAWLYHFDYKTGQYVQTEANHAAGTRLSSNALVAGIKTIKLTNGKTTTIVTDTGGGINSSDDPSSGGSTGAGAKRISWRELTN